MNVLQQLAERDPRVADILRRHRDYALDSAIAVPSESLPDPLVLALRGGIGGLMGTQYDEGFGYKRGPNGEIVFESDYYYPGCELVAELQRLSADRALEMMGLPVLGQGGFSLTRAESGTRANNIVYRGTMQIGDHAVGLKLDHGGHLTHGSSVSTTGSDYRWFHYGVSPDGHMNYDQFETVIRRNRPKVVVVGGSALVTAINFRRCREIVDRVSNTLGINIILMADIAHVLGFIAARVGKFADSDYRPWGHCHVVTSTLQKSRGPNGGLIIVPDDNQLNFQGLATPNGRRLRLAEAIERAFFPNTTGKSHVDAEVAKAVYFKLVSEAPFHAWAQAVLDNTQAMVGVFLSEGLSVFAGGTETHLCLIDVEAMGSNGADASAKLVQAGMYVNANSIPVNKGSLVQSPKKPWGLRPGMVWLSCLPGFGREQAIEFATCMSGVLRDTLTIEAARGRIGDLIGAHRYQIPSEWEDTPRIGYDPDGDMER